MSTLYNLEPQPTAKVLLQTTSGDILLELFAKQIPLASRNFLQHCLDGYYDGTVFHRVVPGFIIQGGDPTGTGVGGESVFDDGAPFADEFHTRLKYNRRGLLGMANSGKPNDNGSQFFLTLGTTPELAGKNTLFGRVVGETIFNVVKMGDTELAEGGDRPLYPTKIHGAEILVNPFDDMVKRERVATRTASATIEKAPKKKSKRKPGKALLSFGDDGGIDTEDLPSVKKPKFNTRLVSEDVKIPAKAAPPPSRASQATMKQPTMASIPSSTPQLPPIPRMSTGSKPISTQQSLSSEESRSPSPISNLTRQKDLKKTQSEIEALKASLRRTGPEAKVESRKPKSALEAMIPETSTRGRKRGAIQGALGPEEAKTLALFNAFRHKLDVVEDAKGSFQIKDEASGPNDSLTGPAKLEAGDNDDEAILCDLHFIANCQSCSNWTEAGEHEDEGGDGWLNHKLSFAKDRLGKSLEWKRKNEQELVVVDPREKARDLGVAKVGYSKDEIGKREWDQDRKPRLNARH